MIEICPCDYQDILGSKNAPEMLAEYAQESAIDGLGDANPQRETYQMLEDRGVMFCFGAYKSGELIGFVSVLLSVLPHFGELVATLESYFVMSEHRTSRAGLGLLRKAELFAKEKGAVGLLVSAPIDGRLDRIMSGLDYSPTNRVHFKAFA
jgi:hypothetical protein